jgi:hypothetical protein
MHFQSSYNHREQENVDFVLRLLSFEGKGKRIDQTLFKVFKAFMDEAKQIKDMSCILLTKGSKYILQQELVKDGKRNSDLEKEHRSSLFLYSMLID